MIILEEREREITTNNREIETHLKRENTKNLNKGIEELINFFQNSCFS